MLHTASNKRIMCLSASACSCVLCTIIIGCILVFFVLPADAYYVSLSDTAMVYPLLVSSETAAPLRWGTGKLAQLQLSSKTVRVSDRGVRFVARPAELIKPGRKAVPSDPLRTCSVLRGAMCRTREYGNVIFPEDATAAVVPVSGGRVRDPLLRDVARSECTQHAARVVSFTTEGYSMTLCDITQKGFEFVLDTDTQLARVVERRDVLAYYVIVSACAVVLMTCLAQDVSYLLGNHEDIPNPFLATLCCLLLFVFAWLLPVNLVVWSDLVYQWFVAAYIVFGISQWLLRLALGVWTHHIHSSGIPFNVIVASLLLALCRLYNGIECQYILPLLFLLAVRSWHKAIAVFHFTVRQSWWWGGDAVAPVDAGAASIPRHVLHEEAQQLFAMDGCSEFLSMLYCASNALDFALLALSHQYGFRPLFLRAYAGDVYFVAMLLGAMCLALLAWERKPRVTHSKS